VRLLLLLALAGLAFAQPREGFLHVHGGPVWYRISGEGKGTPVLALHGGPGGTSCSFYALDPLANSRPIIAYDQLGSGRSGRPTDPGLWQVDRFVEELHTLRKKLGLRRVHLMGHSWGASLAAAYVLSKGTKGLASLTLASPLLSTPDWIRDAEVLKKQLPADVQATLQKHEAEGSTNHPDYRAAEAEYIRRFLRRSAPAPPNPACAESVRNSAIYEKM
jgi:proline iminopeptidase